MATDIYLEQGAKRTFACALEWPGWCRSGAGEEGAIAALAACAPRYAPVAVRAGHSLPADATSFEVVERIAGNATTDFGAPNLIPEWDREPLARAAAGRLADIVAASWAAFDEAAARAPEELRKGPRGGGRNRDKVVEHVMGADSAYARKIGVRLRRPALDDRNGIRAFRDAMLAALRAQSDEVATYRWPVSHAARRIAWHALDHAWEIEDKSNF
jgi:hypothetical protein